MILTRNIWKSGHLVQLTVKMVPSVINNMADTFRVHVTLVNQPTLCVGMRN